MTVATNDTGSSQRKCWWTAPELLQLSPEEMEAIDAKRRVKKYSYRELTDLDLVLTPRADLSSDDRSTADYLIQHPDELRLYREFQRLFEFTDAPAPPGSNPVTSVELTRADLIARALGVIADALTGDRVRMRVEPGDLERLAAPVKTAAGPDGRRLFLDFAWSSEVLPPDAAVRVFDAAPVGPDPDAAWNDLQRVSQAVARRRAEEIAKLLSHSEAALIFDKWFAGEVVPDVDSAAAHRKLWEDEHPGQRYDELDAIPATSTTSDDEPAGPRVYSLAEIKTRPDLLQPRQAIASHLAYRRRTVLVSAREKAGKSTLLTAAASTCTNGSEFLRMPTVPGNVLWVSADQEDAQDVLERAERFGADLDRFHVFYPRGGPLENRLTELQAAVEKVRPVWVIVDTLANFVAGVVEKAAQADQWPSVMLPLRDLARKYELAVTIVHHAKKAPDGGSGGYRDSTAIGGSVDVILEIERDKVQPTWRKITAGGRWALKGITVGLVGDTYQIVDASERAAATPGGQARQRVLDAMGDDEWTVANLVKKVGGGSERGVRRELHGLLEQKLVSVREVREGRATKNLYRRITSVSVAQDDFSDVVEKPAS